MLTLPMLTWIIPLAFYGGTYLAEASCRLAGKKDAAISIRDFRRTVSRYIPAIIEAAQPGSPLRSPSKIVDALNKLDQEESSKNIAAK